MRGTLGKRIVWWCFIWAALGANSAAPQDDGGLYAPSAWDLILGDHAAELPTDQFMAFACGTNGGPSSLPISRWTEYGQCRPEPETGFREVYFEYDNELELWAKAHNLGIQAALYQYTSAYSIPIIASGLFDDRGFLVGLRIISDPRVPEEIRERGVTLAGFLTARYGVSDWICVELPREEGEQEFLGQYEKSRCEKTDPEQQITITLEANNYRKPGQLVIDPVTRRPTVGYFRSETRLEVVFTGEIDNAEERLAAIDTDPASSEMELRIALALDCPGCDFSGADFKRADLTGANLAGANLAGANLHEAILRGANLAGANLDDANLNGADLKLSDLSGATLRGAMMYSAFFDGAVLVEANLSEGLASRVTMAGANLAGAIMTFMDLRGARLTDAYFTDADIRATWLDDALMMRSDFTGALLTQSVMQRVNFTGAILAGADLRAADLIRANFRDADLTNADFSFARLIFALFSGTIIDGAVWTDAELPGDFPPD